MGVASWVRALGESLLPLCDVALDIVTETAVLLMLQQREERGERRCAVADQIHFHRVAQAQHARVNIDLHATRLAFLGQELGVREPGPDHEQGVAILNHFVRGLGAEESNAARDERKIVGKHGFPEECLGYTRAKLVGYAHHLFGSVGSTRPDQDCHALAGVQNVGSALQVGSMRHYAGWAVARTRMGHAVLMSRFSVRCLLDILRQHDACWRPTGTCDAKRAIDDVAHLYRRGHHLHVLVCDVLEQ